MDQLYEWVEYIKSLARSIPAEYKPWIDLSLSISMVVGACLPYIPQYYAIHKSRTTKGFSTYVCLTLLIANILRIAFRMGEKFDDTLLIQAIVMIILQLLLLELCVRMDKENLIYLNQTQPTSKLRYVSKNFWNWKYLTYYLTFISLFSIVSIGLVYMFRDITLLVSTVGFCSTVTESMLAMPQAIENFKNSSVEGMSISMVLMWLGGDLFKTAYYVLKSQPIQFVICGVIQVTLDIIVLIQVGVYRKNRIPSDKGKAKDQQETPSRPKEVKRNIFKEVFAVA